MHFTAFYFRENVKEGDGTLDIQDMLVCIA